MLHKGMFSFHVYRVRFRGPAEMKKEKTMIAVVKEKGDPALA